MAKGLDVQVDSTLKIDCLTSEGFEFVGRYYNTNNPSKNLKLTEAQALSAAGITIVVVWENGFPTKASYFSNAKGVSDATAALKMASESIGQPEGSAIYFAADYDAKAADVSGDLVARRNPGTSTIGHFTVALSRPSNGAVRSPIVPRRER